MSFGSLQTLATAGNVLRAESRVTISRHFPNVAVIPALSVPPRVLTGNQVEEISPPAPLWPAGSSGCFSAADPERPDALGAAIPVV